MSGCVLTPGSATRGTSATDALTGKRAWLVGFDATGCRDATIMAERDDAGGVERRWRRRQRFSCLFLALSMCTCSGKPDATEFDLTDLFPIAVSDREVAQIDFGTADARRFLLEGWSVDEHSSNPDWGTFVWAIGNRSTIQVYLSAPRTMRLVFRCAPFARHMDAGASTDGPQTVEAFINGRPAGRIELQRRFSEYEVVVPQGLWIQGQNRVTFEYAYSRPADEPRTGSDGRQLAVAWDYLTLDGAANAGLPRLESMGETPSVFIPFGSELTFYLKVPANSSFAINRLTIENPPEPAVDQESALEVTIGFGGGSHRRITASTPPNEATPWQVPIGNAAVTAIRLALRAPVPPGHPGANPTSGGLRIVAPVVRTAGTAPAGVSPDLRSPDFSAVDQRHTAGGRDHRLDTEQAPPNVIIYLIDTLRPDHLGAYGYPRQTSPAIDRFALDSVVFETALAQSSWTRATVASIFTGLFSQSHGVNDRFDVLPADLPVVAEILRSAGYATAGVTTNGNVSAETGFDRGFDLYRYLPEEPSSRRIHVYSDVVNREARAWLQQRPRDVPFLLYVHTTDPHDPYTPARGLRERFAAAPALPGLRGRTPAPRYAFAASDIGMGTGDVAAEELVRLYDAEIAFNDHSFGELLDYLEAEDIFDDSLVILLSDHGESFGEHEGVWKHGTSLYEEELRIPLIVKFPQNRGAGRRVADIARQVDVLPTVLDVAGLDVISRLPGRSLVSALDATASQQPEPATHSYLQLDGRHLTAVRQDGLKLLRDLAAETPGATWLFDLENDPHEREDVSALLSVETGYRMALLRALDVLSPRFEPSSIVLSDELRERLRALGYVR